MTERPEAPRPRSVAPRGDAPIRAEARDAVVGGWLGDGLRILHVANGYPPRDLGGVESYTALLCRTLAARGHHQMVLCRTASAGRDMDVIDENVDGVPVRRLVNHFVRVSGFGDYYVNADADAVFRDTVAAWRPDVVHFQHAIGLSASLPASARALGVPSVWSLMDYWPMCPVNHLLLPDGSLCPGSHTGVNCYRCVYGTDRPVPGRHAPTDDAAGAAGRRPPPPGPREASLHALRRLVPRPARLRLWRAADRALSLWPRRAAPRDDGVARRTEYMRAMLAACDAVVALRPFAVDLYADFGVPRDRIRVVDPGMDVTGWRRTPRAPRPRGAPLRVGYIGSLMRQKGIDVLVAALALLPDAAVELHLHGFAVAGDEYGARVLRRARRDRRITVHGRYTRDRLPDLLDGIDVLAVPSPWHETYSFVTWEGVLACLPILASDLGGMRDAVVDGRTGLLLPPGDAGAWARAIADLASSPETVAGMSAAQAGRPVRRVEEAASDLEAIYRELTAGRARASGGSPS